uniref:Zinc finger CW-type PWWP domain protein 1 n=1 Tax=Timema bartmani TaxID=61472 RepID=A0A7R9I1L2_9NEOP|nr:unnamed protein product [Timema bartmani]
MTNVLTGNPYKSTIYIKSHHGFRPKVASDRQRHMANVATNVQHIFVLEQLSLLQEALQAEVRLALLISVSVIPVNTDEIFHLKLNTSTLSSFEEPPEEELRFFFLCRGFLFFFTGDTNCCSYSALSSHEGKGQWSRSLISFEVCQTLSEVLYLGAGSYRQCYQLLQKASPKNTNTEKKTEVSSPKPSDGTAKNEKQITSKNKSIAIKKPTVSLSNKEYEDIFSSVIAQTLTEASASANSVLENDQTDIGQLLDWDSGDETETIHIAMPKAMELSPSIADEPPEMPDENLDQASQNSLHVTQITPEIMKPAKIVPRVKPKHADLLTKHAKQGRQPKKLEFGKHKAVVGNLWSVGRTRLADAEQENASAANTTSNKRNLYSEPSDHKTKKIKYTATPNKNIQETSKSVPKPKYKKAVSKSNTSSESGYQSFEKQDKTKAVKSTRKNNRKNKEGTQIQNTIVKNFKGNKLAGTTESFQPSYQTGSQQLSQSQHSSSQMSRTSSKMNTRERLIWLQERRNVGLWVQCCHAKCSKWRYLADTKDPVEVPELWYCHMNPDRKFNSCEASEMGPTPLEEEDMIHNLYTAGSIVWGHVVGYPWWPAIVDDDPDILQYYWIEFSDIPTHYNVVFFDLPGEAVTRSWLTPSALKSFRTQDKMGRMTIRGVNYSKRIEAARMQANDALGMSTLDRLKKYSFIARYSGPIGNNLGKGNKDRSKNSVKNGSQLLEEEHEDILLDTELFTSPRKGFPIFKESSSRGFKTQTRKEKPRILEKPNKKNTIDKSSQESLTHNTKRQQKEKNETVKMMKTIKNGNPGLFQSSIYTQELSDTMSRETQLSKVGIAPSNKSDAPKVSITKKTKKSFKPPLTNNITSEGSETQFTPLEHSRNESVCLSQDIFAEEDVQKEIQSKETSDGLIKQIDVASNDKIDESSVKKAIHHNPLSVISSNKSDCDPENQTIETSSSDDSHTDYEMTAGRTNVDERNSFDTDINQSDSDKYDSKPSELMRSQDIGIVTISQSTELSNGNKEESRQIKSSNGGTKLVSSSQPIKKSYINRDATDSQNIEPASDKEGVSSSQPSESSCENKNTFTQGIGKTDDKILAISQQIEPSDGTEGSVLFSQQIEPFLGDGDVDISLPCAREHQSLSNMAESGHVVPNSQDLFDQLRLGTSPDAVVPQGLSQHSAVKSPHLAELDSSGSEDFDMED